MKRIILATTCAAAVLALTGAPAHAAKVKPDALIKKAGGKFKGNNIYDAQAEGQRVCVVGGNQYRFVFKVQNDGTRVRRFIITSGGYGGTASSSFSISFEGQDITSAVINGEIPKTNRVAPGEKSKPVIIDAVLSDADQFGTLFIGAGTQEGSDMTMASWRNSGECE